jgi:valyl-tRNA synthetase
MHYVFAAALRLLHPVMPFITEELWHTLDYGADDEHILTARWPVLVDDAVLRAWGIDAGAVRYVDEKHELIRAGRTLRSDYNILPTKKIDYLLKPSTEEAAALLRTDSPSIKSLLKAENLTIDPDVTTGKAMPSAISTLGTVYMPIEGVIDVQAEIKRLSAQMEKADADLERTTRKLENEGFVKKAPDHVVARQKERKEELLKSREKLQHLLDTLTGA